MSVGIGRERQFEIYVDGAPGRFRRFLSPSSASRRRHASGCPPRATRTSRAAPARKETMRQNRAASSAGASSRACCATCRRETPAVDVLGTPLAGPFVLVPHRRARDGPSRRGRRGREGSRGRGHSVRLLEPGVTSDGGDGTRDGRRPALVPARLEHLGRARARASYRGRRSAAAAPSSSRSTRRCSAGGSAISTSARFPFSAARGSRIDDRPGLRRRAAGDASPGPPPGGRITLAAISTLPGQAAAYPGSRLANLRSGLARAAVRRFVETYRGHRSRGTISRSSASARGYRSC